VILPLFQIESNFNIDNVDLLFSLFSELATYELDKSLKMSGQHQAIDIMIESSPILHEWQNAKILLEHTPIYQRYQRDYKNFTEDDYSNLKNEVQNCGHVLSPEQLVFRGMLTNAIDANWNRPLSTTVHPRIAAYHAFKHRENIYPKPDITIAALSFPMDKNVKALVGPFGEGSDFGHEYEVLVSLIHPPKEAHRKQVNGITYAIYSC